MTKSKADSRVEHWDDERSIGNGIIVTLHYGFSFDATTHEGVRGFDTAGEAAKAVFKKGHLIHSCRCHECLTHMRIPA